MTTATTFLGYLVAALALGAIILALIPRAVSAILYALDRRLEEQIHRDRRALGARIVTMASLFQFEPKARIALGLLGARLSTSAEFTPTLIEADARREMASLPPPPAVRYALTIPQGLDPATADLVLKFANAMAQKLRRAEQKYGFRTGWQGTGWITSGECAKELRRHLRKGDPVDVANYCAFLSYHNASTKLPRASGRGR